MIPAALFDGPHVLGILQRLEVRDQVQQLTIVGLPLAILGLFAYVTALYVADIAVAALIGRSLLRPEANLGSFGRALLAGLAILAVGHVIPFLGGAVGWVSLFLGLGLVANRTRLWLSEA